MTKLKVVRLRPSDPHSALRSTARSMPDCHASIRRLSEQQLKNPLIRSAFDRLGNLVSFRGRYLRRLDTVHGDRRTRVEKFVALELIAEQLLVRLDLATSVLGYLDPSNGRYVLNTQCKIADHSGISAAALCRLMKTLDDAGYLYRRIERVRLEEKDENGLHLVRTRVLVRFTKLFWKDLGLAYVFERVHKSAKKKREIELLNIEQRRLAELERHSLELHRREVSRQRWHATKSPRSPSHVGTPEPTQSTDRGPEARPQTSGNDLTRKIGEILARNYKGQ
ncbi:hypothetical protein ALO95_200032 [Pseudomonas syringae pv. antirrhini]|nr:hypothetical protein ALQ23_200214 [Pseudomonas syringae pv. antirrhini]RMW26872.1 hypothetical protein ALO95_200032 [Pseudomonas syringae pv. antirrhini]